jgi:excisionase family DNA binding protein
MMNKGENTMLDDVFTMHELAEYLKLNEKTAYRLVSQGDIPGFKVGGSWRFRRSEIEKWIGKQEQKNKKA